MYVVVGAVWTSRRVLAVSGVDAGLHTGWDAAGEAVNRWAAGTH